MKIDFDSYLLGFYNNKTQAQSSPTLYSQVYVLWEVMSDGFYHSKQWYRTDGPDQPYREGYHKKERVSDTEVIVRNYASDFTARPQCDMLFTWDGEQWNGEIIGDGCILRGNAKVVAEIHLTNEGFSSRDKGIDPDGNVVFGGTLLYDFKREFPRLPQKNPAKKSTP